MSVYFGERPRADFFVRMCSLLCPPGSVYNAQIYLLTSLICVSNRAPMPHLLLLYAVRSFSLSVKKSYGAHICYCREGT